MDRATQYRNDFVKAVPKKRMLRFDWMHCLGNHDWDEYPLEEIDCVPLHAGRQVLTLCEIDQTLVYNRLITIFPEDIQNYSGIILEVSGYADFYRWALRRNARKLPRWFPKGETFAEIVQQALPKQLPVMLHYGEHKTSFGRLVGCDDTTATVLEISARGEYIWESDCSLESVYRIDIGGAREMCLFEHAKTSKTDLE